MTFGKKKDGDAGNTDGTTKISKKGVVLTCIIVASILGASFIVWFLPSDNVPTQSTTNNMTVTFGDPNATLMSTESQFTLLQSEVQNYINETSPDTVENMSEFNSFVDTSIAQNNELMLSLLNQRPDQSIMPDYMKLMGEMKNYSQYLSGLKNMTLK
jgi:hypothetical protein